VKLLAFIFGLGILLMTNAHAQGFNGAYRGSLLTDKNLLIIEEQGGHTFIKLFLSEKESIQVIGQISNQKLTFPFPQNEGEDLAVCAELSEDSSLLTLAFELEGISYSTPFERIASPKRDLVKIYFEEANTDSLDLRIIGNWVRYLSKDSTGKAEKDNILTKKAYVTSFMKNGLVVYDLQMIRDVFKENGYTKALDYTQIPKANWFTSSDNRITIIVDGTAIEYRYEVSSDSLKFITDIGSTQYYVRKY
jgi:hypothetical protein